MNVEKYTHIKRSELDEGDYFESLIVKAYELGFVTQTDIESIQDACFELLAQNLRRTYGDTSTSASTERAESMMDSVVYTLGVGLKTFKTPDEALDFLLEHDISTLFYRGMRRINEMISKIKEMADVLKNELAPDADTALLYTVSKIIPTFLKKYNPEISAHDNVVLPIYPVDFEYEKYKGVEYIFAYTAALLKSNDKS